MPEPAAPYIIGKPLIELDSVESTNNYAMAQIHAGLAQAGMAIMAYEQTMGKGQRGKTWIAGKNENINLSVITRPEAILSTDLFMLTTLTALSVHQLIGDITNPDNVTIKWPNDIYWRDRKAAGILIENIWRKDSDGEASRIAWSVIGIGVNVNTPHFPAHLPNPVSLKQITGNTFHIKELVLKLCNNLEKYWQHFAAGEYDLLLKQYNQKLYKKGTKTKLKKDNRVFEAEIVAAMSNGDLLIKHALEEMVSFGNIEWVQ